MDFLRLLLRYGTRYWPQIAAVIVLQLVTTLATLYLPDLNAEIIDNGVAQGDVAYIWRTGRTMLLVALIQVATAIGAVWFASYTAMRTGRDIRSAVYSKVSSFNQEDFHHFGTPTLITRGTNDVQQVHMTFLLALNFMVAAPIMAIGGVIMALRQDAGMSWLVIAAVGALAVVVTILAALLMPMFKTMQERLDAINGLLREQIAGIRVVRAFSREDYEAERFAQANTDISRVSLNIGRIFVMMFPLIMLILNVATAAVLWFGGHRVEDGLIDVGALTAFIQYLMQILMAVMMGVFMLMMLPRALVCGHRIRDVLRYDVNAAEGEQDPETRDGIVEFRNVFYTYPGSKEPALKNVSFTARPGTTTAIIGSTGSGKSTLIGLIPQLYAPTEGSVLIDGSPTTDLTRTAIVDRVAAVPQKPWLFSGTVASNLRIANPHATDENLWQALDIAQVGFVEDLDMSITQGGTNISGGQRQRLCIARALVSEAPVLLFDDSFSALDAVTEANLRDALKSSHSARTATQIVVAQKVSSIRDADQILVMEGGEIVARGTHAELMHDSQIYQDIEASQQVVDA